MDSDRKRRTPRRPAPAVVAREERNRLTRAWLDVYASDSDFLVALESLADAHKTVVAELDELAYARGWRATGLTWRELTDWPAELGEQPSAVCDYRAAIRDFAARWSLHLLPDNQGFSALVDYCFARHVDAAPARKFAATVQSQPFAIKRLVPCSVSISLADLWDPTQETKSEAKARLGALLGDLLDAELERVARAHEDAGYVFSDTKNAERRHLEWLYRKQVKGETNEDLASESNRSKPDGRSEKAILDEIRTVAAALGIPIPRQQRKVPRRI